MTQILWKWGVAIAVGTSVAIADVGVAGAQIVPDDTLGAESSLVSPTEAGVRIDGGALRGGNLFHSFEEFSVPTNREALFNNNLDVRNIFSRVTGSSISDIDGLIRANGAANLFLLNPNGIVFGPNARLDIGGSFLASTADSVLFENELEFNATNPENSTALLSVNVPLGLQFNGNPGDIINRASTTSLEGNITGLEVQPTQSLTLVGGDILFDGGGVNAPGGRLEMGGLAEAGIVGLNAKNITTILDFSQAIYLGNITLTNLSRASVRGVGGGDIVVYADRLTANNGGRFIAGTTGNGNSGDIQVFANRIDVSGNVNQTRSGFFNQGLPGSQGDVGNIILNSSELTIASEGIVFIFLAGDGNGGDIIVNSNIVNSVEDRVFGAEFLFGSSGFYNAAEPGSSGSVGNINIQAETLNLVRSNIEIFPRFNSSNAGNLTLEANRIYLSESGVFLGSAGSGISGELRVVADEIELDRSDIGTSIFTDGMSGDITIVANSLKLNNGSSIFSATSTSILDDIFDDESVPDLLRRGSSGNINIRVRDTLELQGTNFDTNSSISSSVLGVGNSGNISIEASRLRLADGARILTQAENGNVGEINLRITGDMTLDGFQEIGLSQFPTIINTQSTGTGDTGNISIETARLTLTNGARISTATTNSGNAGSIRVEASEILLDGEILENALQPQPTQITTDVFTENAVVTGLGGTLTLNADRITISNGAQISALTFSQGDAGSIAIQTTELQAIDGTISTQTFGPGNAGAIEIDAQTVRLSDGATLTSGASFPDPFNLEGDRNVGRGGTITVRASELLELDSGSQILGDVSVNTDSQGGNIILDGDRVRIRGGSSVTSSNFGIGNAGTVNLRANDLQIIGSSSRLLAEANGGIIVDPARFTDLIGGSDPTADLSSIIELTRAVGGTIAVDAERLEVRDGGTISVSSGGISEPGNVQLQIGDRLRLDNRGRIAASSVTGNGGNININARNIRLRRRSQMSAAGSPVDPTFDGNITLNTETLALLEGSQIVTSSADPQGGSNIEIRPWENDLVVLQSPDSLINATGQLAIEGDIDVQQPDLPEVDVVDAAAILATDPCATGRDSEFYITGRGGLPPNPESILPGNATWVDLRSPQVATPELTSTPDDETSQLVEAQGWYVNREGNVVLSAQTANAEPNLPPPQPDSCSPNNSTR